MNQKPGFILTIIFLFFFVQSFSQNIQDRIKTVSVKTIDGNTFLGTVVSEDINNLIIRTESLGEIIIPKNKIKSKTEIRNVKIVTNSDETDNKNKVNLELLNHKLQKAKSVQKTGAILGLSGITAVGVGFALAQYGWQQNTPTSDPKSIAAGDIGILIFLAGIPATCLGGIIFLAGTDQKASVKKKLEMSVVNIKSPMSSRSVNGLRLTLSF